ncbi:class I SAM-dependent methyltransferase [Planctomycetota bacterium]|nr:class I SAM-dependent methyltransferase [Planctomycetota bacterium]
MAVKKDAVLLRMLVGEGAREEEDAPLLRASLAMATWRVAVKRPRGSVCDWSLRG